jgi:hypothetical protein
MIYISPLFLLYSNQFLVGSLNNIGINSFFTALFARPVFFFIARSVRLIKPTRPFNDSYLIYCCLREYIFYFRCLNDI